MRYANYFISVHHFTNEAMHLTKTPDELKVLNNIENRSPILFEILKECAVMTARNLNINHNLPALRFENLRTIKENLSTPAEWKFGELFDVYAEDMFQWTENSPHQLHYRNFTLKNKGDYAITRLVDAQANLYEERLPLVSVLYRPQHPLPNQDSWIVFLPTMPVTYFIQFPNQVEFNYLEDYGLIYDWERFQPHRFEPNQTFRTHEQFALWQWLNVPDSVASLNPYLERLSCFHQVNLQTIGTFASLNPKSKPTVIKANCPKFAWHMLHPAFNWILQPLPYEDHHLISELFDESWFNALQKTNYEDDGLWLVIADDLDERKIFPELSNLIRFFCTEKEIWRL